MLTNAWNNVLYTGVTNSLEKRIWQHKNKSIDDFTKTYNCDRLVFFEIHQDIKQAIAPEKQIKSWSRAKKNSLVDSMNAAWNDLAEDWYEAFQEGDPSPSARLGMTRDERHGQ